MTESAFAASLASAAAPVSPASPAAADAVPFVDLAAMHRLLRADLDQAWHDAVDRSGFVGGAAVESFEQAWADYCEVEHAIGVANGTDAITLALRGLGIGIGDEVILPANTFVATAEAVVLVGATPVFVDVDPATLLMTAAHVEAAITSRTAAVMAVHLYGQMVDMDALGAVVRRHHLLLVEDCAQAHGATWRGRIAGSFGHAGCFSFYPGKNLGALGDGGAVVTDDAALARRIRCLADHGRNSSIKGLHDLAGTNSRLDGLQAALLSVKLLHLDDWNAARRAAMRRYEHRLAGTPVVPVTVRPEAEPVHHLAVVQVEHRHVSVAALSRRHIGTGVHYPIPCHRQPAFAEWAREPLPVCEAAADRILSLPMYPTITSAQIDRVCSVLTSSALLTLVPAPGPAQV